MPQTLLGLADLKRSSRSSQGPVTSRGSFVHRWHTGDIRAVLDLYDVTDTLHNVQTEKNSHSHYIGSGIWSMTSSIGVRDYVWPRSVKCRWHMGEIFPRFRSCLTYVTDVTVCVWKVASSVRAVSKFVTPANLHPLGWSQWRTSWRQASKYPASRGTMCLWPVSVTSCLVFVLTEIWKIWKLCKMCVSVHIFQKSFCPIIFLQMIGARQNFYDDLPPSTACLMQNDSSQIPILPFKYAPMCAWVCPSSPYYRVRI